ncbi:tRNA pseudouridine synthase-like 1 isoform X2 [Bicyclus anynana]|uniref:tRNA pseudouridine synthase n=1 Tax=Bicyclus anynana TaxID=110368 RepID=A0A6J1P3T9_BICAN|nr:tRNA pseudouridine synthase-like 1 isoform X2 [Bicyclus anynana]
MMKARYLTFFSYIGTKFSTDGGVHALNSSAHFDLDRKGDNIYDPHYITYEMNKFFFHNELSIYVRKCLRVNDNFSARFNAVSRTYLYRLAVLKPEVEEEEKGVIASFIPIEEWKRCHFIRKKEFDVERFKKGAEHLVGYHDFATFKKFDKLLQHKHNRREIKSIVVKPGQPCTTSYTNSAVDNCFNYWDIEIKGRSFVHNQIRRMVGTLISIAIGKLEPDDIKVMLQVPSKHSWHTFIQNGPPDGLYLCNVEYNPEDLIYDPERSIANSIVNNEELDCE